MLTESGGEPQEERAHQQEHQGHRRGDTAQAGQLQNIGQVRRTEHGRNSDFWTAPGSQSHRRLVALLRRSLRPSREEDLVVVAKTHLLRAVPEEERRVHKEDDRPHCKLRQSRANSQRKHFPPYLRSSGQQYEEQP